jgi:hypothetical protein
LSIAFRFAIIVCAAMALSGCGKSASYHYKLTLSVETPEGVKTGSSVTEVVGHEVTELLRTMVPTEQHMTFGIRGEALYLDLGPGRRPLIALLTSFLHGNNPNWTRDWGPAAPFLLQLYGKDRSGDFFDWARRIAESRGPRPITPADLPDLVTFPDVNDPKSVVEVDPNDLGATLGPGVEWRAITLEVTDEPVTNGIAEKLRWLKELTTTLAGTMLTGRDAASLLNAGSFRSTR